MNKETLRKKIESGDMVWRWWKWANPVEIHQFKLEKKYKIVKDTYLVDDTGKILEIISNLFATKEEAEWELEFGNITRTEKLELPTWERFTKNPYHPYFTITGKYTHHGYVEVDFNAKNEKVISVCGKYFDFTYAGYLEACRLCKKLFLGEEKL